jgi:hypothetical protein
MELHRKTQLKQLIILFSSSMTIFSKIIRVTFWTVHIFFSSSDRDKKFSDHILNHPAMMQRHP